MQIIMMAVLLMFYMRTLSETLTQDSNSAPLGSFVCCCWSPCRLQQGQDRVWFGAMPWKQTYCTLEARCHGSLIFFTFHVMNCRGLAQTSQTASNRTKDHIKSRTPCSKDWQHVRSVAWPDWVQSSHSNDWYGMRMRMSRWGWWISFFSCKLSI